MKIENQIRAFAGTFILLSLLLAKFHNPNWIYFTAFVGLNLLQSSITKFCPLEMVLKKIQPEKA
jgi:hypothetical protein